MASPKDRRGFLGLLGIAASGAALAALGRPATADAAQEEAKPKKSRKKGGAKGKRYKGLSKAGKLQEALDLAVKAAVDGAPGADREVKWTLKRVSGRAGTIAGVNEVTVVIEASVT